jgi:hypothetical protein
MRITSEDRNTVLEIIANDPHEPYFGYRFTAIVEDGLNSFSGQNDGVLFSELDRFLKEFASFIETREASAILEMTEDCCLEFFRWNMRGDVGVKVRITKIRSDADGHWRRNTLAIEFKIDSEFVNQVYEDFARLQSV